MQMPCGSSWSRFALKSLLFCCRVTFMSHKQISSLDCTRFYMMLRNKEQHIEKGYSLVRFKCFTTKGKSRNRINLYTAKFMAATGTQLNLHCMPYHRVLHYMLSVPLQQIRLPSQAHIQAFLFLSSQAFQLSMFKHLEVWYTRSGRTKTQGQVITSNVLSD